MKVQELVRNIDKLHGQRVEISGYMHVAHLFSYMYISDYPYKKDDGYVLIEDDRIFTCLESARLSVLVGSPVLYAGWTILVCSVYKNWGFPMFSAVIRSVSEISFEYFKYENSDEKKKCILQERFFDPKKNLYLEGGTPLNNKQVQTIKHIVKGTDNFIAIKNKFSKEGKHMLAFYLDTPALNRLQQQLEQIGITNYCWGYFENDLDTFEVAGYGYL